MAKRTDIRKILLIGSGPIVIGQGAEFDYAGTQACLALREEGYQVVLCNSNPATIMTDPAIADQVYMEPLSLEYLTEILRRERPDAMIPGMGGQTGLNLAMELEEKGILRELGVELLGTDAASIRRAEDRGLFKEMCQSIGEPVIPSEIAYNPEEARAAALRIGYPVVLRPAFTLGGTGGGFASDQEELTEICSVALQLSPVHQVLVEKSVKGYQELEFEVMGDACGNVVTVCGMENLDPVGVHTGDSIVVAPILSLSSSKLNILKNSALRLIRELKIKGGCNVQFALKPASSEYFVIEVNPRVSRSSALASKASAYPIARVSAKVAVGMDLREIPVAGGWASEEPAPDYFAAKLPRFPFDKFAGASHVLGTQMKATGEAMGIGSSLEEALLKAVRSLETGACHFHSAKFDAASTGEILDYLSLFHDDNVFAIFEAIRRGVPMAELHRVTRIRELFLERFCGIAEMEKRLAAEAGNAETLRAAKAMGFSDKYIAGLWKQEESAVYRLRKEQAMVPAFRMVDSLHSGSSIPYFYSSYTGENQSKPTDRRKIVVLGAGPIRIGQGIEFDYSAVHAVQAIKRAGWEAIIINNNPETVSTDYATADKLYFEPLTAEDVMAVIDLEKPEGVIVSLGGQTAVNLAKPLADRGVKIIGTDWQAIERAENREAFGKILQELNIPQPPGQAVTSIEAGVRAAAEIGYPVLVRPSFVLGGRAMEIVADDDALRHYLGNAVEIDRDKPVLVDKYMEGREIEVDAICDGVRAFVPGIMELVEKAGVHSGDSISVYPSFSLSRETRKTILRYTEQLGLAIGIMGLYNIQFLVDKKERVFVIEVNPRSSRTVPFLSKASGLPLADIGTNVMLGRSLKEQGILQLSLEPEEIRGFSVKVPVFSFSKIKGMDPCLSPEMKSTGEVIGQGKSLSQAMDRAFLAAGIRLQKQGVVLVSLADENKEEALPLIRRLHGLGFSIEATRGTAAFLASRGVCVSALDGSWDGEPSLPEEMRRGNVSFVVNTRAVRKALHTGEGAKIRRCAVENGVPLFTSLDTVRVLLDMLEERA